MTSVAVPSATGGAHQNDLIESKFNELARQILEELKQAQPKADFFSALDQILSEPPARRQDVLARRQLQAQKRRQLAAKSLQDATAALAAKVEAAAAKSQQPQKIEVTTITSNQEGGAEAEALKKRCDMIAERQRQQQEQLDSHQQILFDSQYRSLPSEITQAVAGHEQRRATARAVAAAAQKPATAVGQIKSQKSLDESHAAARSSKLQQSSRPSDSNSAHQQSNGLAKRPTVGASGSPIKRGVVGSASSSSLGGGGGGRSQARSAIPQSTVLSGISGAAAAAYPLAKSATTTAATTTVTASEQPKSPAPESTGLVRQASLKINKQTREAQQEFIKRHTMGASLTASEKLRQRRPTKAALGTSGGGGGGQTTSDDSDLDEDDDDDDDYEYQNLASRRAYLNQRFIDQKAQLEEQQQQAQVSKSKTLSDASKTRADGQSPNRQQQQQQQQQSQQQTTINPASQVAKQRQRFSQGGAPLVRSSTVGPSSRPATFIATATATGSRPSSRTMAHHNHDDEPRQVAAASPHQQEPRSLGGLLTSHDIGQLYKPHMNYSTSLLGNHRLSDDDEIIIIPTAQSPSLMSASVSPDPRHHPHHHHYHPRQYSPAGGQSGAVAAVAAAAGEPDQSTNNMDEFSERFSISRTKSFWEKLANSKKLPPGSSSDPQQQHDKQYFNSSIRSLASSGGGAGPNLVAVDVKSSHETDLNKSTHSSSNQSPEQHQHQRYPAAMKSAFERMDSTGGSGNSHYSGCSSNSSTSGDELQANGSASYSSGARLQSTGGAKSGSGRPKANPAINQLIRQDELNRADRFRQTR